MRNVSTYALATDALTAAATSGSVPSGGPSSASRDASDDKRSTSGAGTPRVLNSPSSAAEKWPMATAVRAATASTPARRAAVLFTPDATPDWPSPTEL